MKDELAKLRDNILVAERRYHTALNNVNRLRDELSLAQANIEEAHTVFLAAKNALTDALANLQETVATKPYEHGVCVP